MVRRSPWCCNIVIVVSLGHAGTGAQDVDHDLGREPGGRRSRPRTAVRTTARLTTPTGAMIVEHREVDVAATGEVRIAGVPATLDPASVQLRSISDAGDFSGQRAAVRSRCDDARRDPPAPRRRAGHDPDAEGRGRRHAALGRCAGARRRGRYRRSAPASSHASRWLTCRTCSSPSAQAPTSRAWCGTSRRRSPASTRSRSRIAPRVCRGPPITSRSSTTARRRSTSRRGRRSRMRRARRSRTRSSRWSIRSAITNGASERRAIHRARRSPARHRRVGAGRAVPAAHRREDALRRRVRSDAGSIGELPAVPGGRLQPAERERRHVAFGGLARGRRADEGCAAGWSRAAVQAQRRRDSRS